jgi:hypothetical protein
MELSLKKCLVCGKSRNVSLVECPSGFYVECDEAAGHGTVSTAMYPAWEEAVEAWNDDILL